MELAEHGADDREPAQDGPREDRVAEDVDLERAWCGVRVLVSSSLLSSALFAAWRTVPRLVKAAAVFAIFVVTRKHLDFVPALLQGDGGIDDQALCSACGCAHTCVCSLTRVRQAGQIGRVVVVGVWGRSWTAGPGEEYRVASQPQAAYAHHSVYGTALRALRLTESEVRVNERDPESTRQVLRRVLRRVQRWRTGRFHRAQHCDSDCRDEVEESRSEPPVHVKCRRQARKSGDTTLSISSAFPASLVAALSCPAVRSSTGCDRLNDGPATRRCQSPDPLTRRFPLCAIL